MVGEAHRMMVLGLRPGAARPVDRSWSTITSLLRCTVKPSENELSWGRLAKKTEIVQRFFFPSNRAPKHRSGAGQPAEAISFWDGLRQKFGQNMRLISCFLIRLPRRFQFRMTGAE